VRIAPNELAYSSPQAWKDIYGHRRGNNSTEELPKFQGFYFGISKHPSILSEPTREDHRFIRRIISPGFSEKNMREQELILMNYIDLFVNQLKAHCQDTKGLKLPVDIVTWFNSATFDIIGDLTFGRPFGSLATGEENPWVKNINEFAALGGATLLATAHLGGQTLLRKLAVLFNRGQEKHISVLKDTLRKRMETKAARPDLIDGLVRGKDGIVRNTLLFSLYGL
jgi:cytochrome P450